MSKQKLVGSAALKLVPAGEATELQRSTRSIFALPGSVPEYLAQSAKSSLLRFATAGSVDDGKSTLVGRLLHDTDNILEDHLAALQQRAKKEGSTSLALALVTDGLKAEREQGITIDVAYRYFSTNRRRFILADCPGHEQYTRNMATGCSTADLMIVLVDARHGIVSQTKRHSFIGSLLGVPRFLIAINKMDLVDYSQAVFDKIAAEFSDFAAKLGIKELKFVPISALLGDNVVTPSQNMDWYHGETVMDYLESVYTGGDSNLIDFRLPVQGVLRPNQDYRGFTGQIASGEIRVGEEIVVLPGMQRSKVSSIDVYSAKPEGRSLQKAIAPMSVAIQLADEVDVGRGAMLVRPANVPAVTTSFEAMVVWMSDTPLDLATRYIISHTSRSTKATISELRYRIDVNTLSRQESHSLAANEVGRVSLESADALFIDPYKSNRATGSFVLIDPRSFTTVAAGMILDRHVADDSIKRSDPSSANTAAILHLEESVISRAKREEQLGAKAVTIWLTGLSGSGKSTVAKELENRLFSQKRAVYRLDGDNLRSGLNSDLGFSEADRAENIRRVAEVAKLFNQAGVSVVCALISPLIKDREMARNIIGPESFVEVYLSTPIEICKQRDPHGLYKRALAGEIKNFTGVSAPYEPPTAAQFVFNTAEVGVDGIVREVLGES